MPVIQLENPRVINSTSPHNHKHQHQRQLKYQHQDIHEHQHQHHHDTPGHSNPLRHLSLSPAEASCVKHIQTQKCGGVHTWERLQQN